MKNKHKKTIKYSAIIFLSFILILTFLNLSALTPFNLESPKITPNNDLQNSQTTHLEDLIISKSETISAEFNAIGEIIKSSTTIDIEIANNQTEDVTFDFYDRIEATREIEPSLETPIPSTSYKHGVLFLNWTDLTVRAGEELALNYLAIQNKSLPVNISMSYYLDGHEINPDKLSDGTYKLDAGLNSNLTISITLANYDEGLFVSTEPVKPITIAMVTLALPLEMFGEPSYNMAPIMSNAISGVNQITFIALVGENPTTLNTTVQIIEGGGWGVIELEPLRVDVMRSPEMFYTVITALNAVLGVVTGLEGYWTYLTIESMLDQLTLFSPLLELITDILITDFSVFNTLLNSLITIQGYSIEELIDNMINGPGLIRNLISLENIRELLNSTTTSGYPDAENLILDELDLIENSTVQAIGSEMLSLIGCPADITLYKYY